MNLEQENYKNLTPFKFWTLTNFPFIEQTFDSLTNYGLLCKLGEYLNNLEYNQNAVQTNMTNLYTYVSDYFKNLDVTEDINNKLDELASDGTLTNLISNYLNPFINEQNNKINLQDNQISIINEKVNVATSGSPAGVYETLAELQSADPDHSKIYLVLEDGEWYFWNIETEQWKNGGVYQASGIAPNSIKSTDVNYLSKGINQMIINSGIYNNVSITQDVNGFISVIGTPSVSQRVIVGKLEVETTEDYTIRSSGTKTFPVYLINSLNEVAATLYTTQNILDVNLPTDTYTIEIWLTNTQSYTDKCIIDIHKSSENIFLQPVPWFKPSLNNIPNNSFNSDDTIIKNFKTVNSLRNSPNVEHAFVFDIVNNKFKQNNGLLVFNDSFNGDVPFEHLAYRVNNTYNDEIDLSDSLAGLNAIFYNIKTGHIHKENYSDWYNTDKVNKYDYVLLIYFYLASRSIVTDYIKVSDSIYIESKLKDKKLSICGVSIDTYAGYIPEGNSAYYSNNNLTSVNNTWWKKLLDKTGMQLLINNSWSGSRATTTNGVLSSGVHRCLNLDNGIDTPDYIIIGTFMFNDWLYSEVGTYNIGDELPDINVDLTDLNNYNIYKNVVENYSGAMATIINRIQRKYPDAKLFVMDGYEYYRNGTNPTYANSNKYLSQYNKALYDICEKFGVEIIKLSECGLTATNSKKYTVDGTQPDSTIGLHPNSVGMEMLYNETYQHFKKFE